MTDFHVVRPVTACLGHLGEQRSRGVSWSPAGSQLDQMVGEDAG